MFAGLFIVVERFVCGVISGIKGGGVGDVLEADTGADFQRYISPGHLQTVQRLSDLVDTVGGFFRVGMREQDGEFIAADAGCGIHATDMLHQAFSNLSQAGVTGLVAIGVVYRFELVEVNHQQNAAEGIVAARALQFLCEESFEAAAVQ